MSFLCIFTARSRAAPTFKQSVTPAIAAIACTYPLGDSLKPLSNLVRYALVTWVDSAIARAGDARFSGGAAASIATGRKILTDLGSARNLWAAGTAGDVTAV